MHTRDPALVLRLLYRGTIWVCPEQPVLTARAPCEYKEGLFLSYYIILRFFCSAPAGTAGDGAVEGSVGEGKAAQDYGTRGRYQAGKWTFWGCLGGFNSRMDPGIMSSSLGHRASSSAQVSASPACCGSRAG